MGCELCEQTGGTVLWRDEFCRVVRVASEEFPGFCRVILARHAREMTDLAGAERERLMRVVFACEQALRAELRPDKINLASLGNQVAHLHWHVIARFADDSRFPDPIWAAPRRVAARRNAPEDRALGAQLARLLA
jgi:diadenosine tetraphosphate (Ap4A) HIT family hydrolase